MVMSLTSSNVRLVVTWTDYKEPMQLCGLRAAPFMFSEMGLRWRESDAVTSRISPGERKHKIWIF